RLQSAQAFLHGRENIRLRRIPHPAVPPRNASVADLRGDYDIAAPSGKRLAEQLLVPSPVIQVGGVEIVDAELQRFVHDGYGALLLRAERHAAETDLSDLDAGCAERVFLHDGLTSFSRVTTM